MPGVAAFPTRKEFCLLETTVPRRAIGVLLIESGAISDFRLRSDWSEFEDTEYLEALTARAFTRGHRAAAVEASTMGRVASDMPCT